MMAAALALSVAACAIARAESDVPETGSLAETVSESEQEPEAVAETESETVPEQAFDVEPGDENPKEPPFDNGFDEPTYESIDLKRDNPLSDAEVASVSLCLYGVGETKLSADYANVIAGIVQNDARVWQNPAADSGKSYGIYERRSPAFIVTLASGEELEVHAHKASGSLSHVLSINDEDYELTADEYTSFKALYEGACEWLISASDTYVAPYAGLTKDDLARIERIGTFYATEGNEQYLTESQVDLVIESLNNLYVVPSTANFNPDGLAGGSYEYFKLWFKDGTSVMIGAYDYYSVYDESYNLIDRYPVAYFDGVLFRCNEGYAEDMYWNHEESAEGYRRQYLSARIMPDYPFEELTADEVQLILVELEDDSNGWTTGLASRSLAEDVVDVLKQLKRTEDNLVHESDSDLNGLVASQKTILTILLSNGERVLIDADESDVYINYGRYAQETGVADGIKTLIGDARESHAKLIESVGERTLVEAKASETPSGFSDIFGDGLFGMFGPGPSGLTFELPSVLVEHNDGYYPEGYSLEDAPVSVTVTTYSSESGDEITNRSRLEEEMSSVGGQGYSEFSIFGGQKSATLITHWGMDGQDTELLYDDGLPTGVEILIKGNDGFDVSPEAVLALVLGSAGAGDTNQQVTGFLGNEFR